MQYKISLMPDADEKLRNLVELTGFSESEIIARALSVYGPLKAFLLEWPDEKPEIRVINDHEGSEYFIDIV